MKERGGQEEVKGRAGGGQWREGKGWRTKVEVKSGRGGGQMGRQRQRGGGGA